MSVAAGDQQVGALVLSDLDQLGRTGALLLHHDPGATLDAVTGEITRDVLEPEREVAQQPLSLVRVVELGTADVA